MVAASGTSAAAAPEDIQQFVARTAPTDAEIAEASPRELLDLFVRCHQFAPGTTYCLHLGWVAGNGRPASLDATLDSQAEAPQVSDTGAASLLGEIRALAAKPQQERAAEEAALARQATGALPRVRAEQASVQGALAPSVALEPAPTLPASASVMTTTHYRKQINSVLCGSAVTQMSALYKGVNRSQPWWRDTAGLGTGPSADQIGAALNRHGGYPGYYAVVTFTSTANFHQHAKQSVASRLVPMPTGVMLKKAYFSYLKLDHGQHWQVVRAYTATTIGIYEPYNEADFHSGGAASGRGHSLPVGTYYSAVRANLNRAILV
jgi:hypothetical protein